MLLYVACAYNCTGANELLFLALAVGAAQQHKPETPKKIRFFWLCCCCLLNEKYM